MVGTLVVRFAPTEHHYIGRCRTSNAVYMYTYMYTYTYTYVYILLYSFQVVLVLLFCRIGSRNACLSLLHKRKGSLCSGHSEKRAQASTGCASSARIFIGVHEYVGTYESPHLVPICGTSVGGQTCRKHVASRFDNFLGFILFWYPKVKHKYSPGRANAREKLYTINLNKGFSWTKKESKEDRQKEPND